MRRLFENLDRISKLIKVRQQELFDMTEPSQIVQISPKVEVHIQAVSIDNVDAVASFREQAVAERFHRHLKEGQYGFYALVDSRVVGHAWAIVCNKARCMCNRYMNLRQQEALIHFCAVEEGHRGKNIYPAMLTVICKTLLEQANVTRIVIDTEVDNLSAIRSIRKVGFQSIGRRTYLQFAWWLVYTHKYTRPTGLTD